MDLFAPSNLPGVGMGDLESVGGVAGLLGLAATSGALVAARIPGTLVFLASATAVLLANDERWGGQPVLSLGALGLVAIIVLTATLTRRSALSWGAVLAAGASVGYAWAEWNEGEFSGADTEALVGIAIAVVAAAGAAWGARRFVEGSLRAGGDATIVCVAVAVVAFVLNTASFYVPFVGAAVFLVSLVVGLRLGRRDREKYKGLRILS